MRIAIFTDNFYPELSGVADSVLLQATGLAARGHEVTIVAPKYSAYEYERAGINRGEPLLPKGVNVERVFSWSAKTATGQGRATFPGFGFLKVIGKKFDIVHSHSFLALGFDARLLARSLKAPLVGTNHTALEHFLDYVPKPLRKLFPKIQVWYYAHVDAYTSPSSVQMNLGERAPICGVIPNAIETEFFVDPIVSSAKPDPRVFTFLYVGRISREKNSHELVNLFIDFFSRFPDAKTCLRLIGGGIMKDELIEKVRRSGFSSRILFEGPYMGANKSFLYRAYRESDCFITLSPSEVQPLTILQAFASGLPVIAADNPALSRIVGRKRGVLVDPLDVNQCVDIINMISREARVRKEMSDAALAHAANFMSHSIAQRWEDLFNHVLDERERTPTIDLVISAYNEEKYIGETLEYVTEAARGLVNEIIVIDNASSDRTAEIAGRFTGVRVVREERKGLTSARERGFQESKADLIGFLDADGHMRKGWVERTLHEFKKNPRLVCLSGPALYYDVSFFAKLAVRIYWIFGYIIYLFVGYMAQGGNFVLRRSSLVKMGGFDTRISFYGEDTDIARRASNFGVVKFSLSHTMHTSPRRFKGEGFAHTAVTYIKNFTSIVFIGKPATSDYTDHR